MILALINNSMVHIAANSSSNTSNNYYNHVKIFKCPNEVIMAGEGNPQTIELIVTEHPFQELSPTYDNCKLYMLRLLNKFGDDGFNSMRWAFLICGSARIYMINSEGVITEAEAFEGIGNGREVGLAVLEVTNGMQPETRLKMAFEIAAKYCNFVKEPITTQFI